MRIRRLFTVGLVVAACVTLTGCDWAQIGFGPANTGVNPSEPALTRYALSFLHLAWSAACQCGKPLVVGGTVYVVDTVPGGSVTLRAFDTASGGPRWSTVVGVNVPGTTFEVKLDAVVNGLAYVRVTRFGIHGQPLESGRVVAYDAATGVLRWTVTPPAAGSGAATFGPNLIVDGTVAYVATNATASAELTAIDTDGRVLWSVTPGGFGGALAADPGRAVYMMTGVLVTQTGRDTVVPVLASFGEGLGEPLSAVLPAIGPVGVARIAFANGLVYGYQDPLVGTGGVGLFAVHPSTGQLAWSTASSDLGAVGAVVVGSILGGQGLSAHDPITGAPVWTTTKNAPAVDPVIAGEFVYFGMGAIVLVYDTTGRSVSDPVVLFPEAVMSITPSNGRVFVATTGHLVALAP